MKTCTKCDETKPLDEFVKAAQNKDGRATQCKECQRAHRQANREAKREYDRAHYLVNRERINEQNRAYHEAHRDHLLEKKREHYHANLEQMVEQSRRYRESNREQINAHKREHYHANRDTILEGRRGYYYANQERLKETSRDYWRTNREQMRAYDRRRYLDDPPRAWTAKYRQRAKKYGYEPVVEPFTKPDVIARYGDTCFYCKVGAFEHLEHAIPVARDGAHTLDNVRPSCAACNRAKKDMTDIEFLASMEDSA